MKLSLFTRARVSQKGSAAASAQTPSALSLLLHPGIGIKRWALLTGFGLLMVALGVAFLLPVSISPSLLAMARQVTLSWLPPLARGLIIMSVGVLLVAFSGRHLYGTLVQGLLGGKQTKVLLQDLHQYRTRTRGPVVVAIGGGTGLSTLLRGLKFYTRNITAVVTVADDGGSSGRLRTELAIPPPGDARNCLVALSDVEPLMERLMQYRFTNGAGLEGHSFGNLLLAALTDLEDGFDHGLDSAAQLLGVNGRVLPGTLSSDVVLNGMTRSGEVIRGESKVGTSADPLKHVWLEPEHVMVNPAVIEAVRDADVIVIGPGSLYTSVIPNFLVGNFRAVVEGSRVPKVFVCNVATQPGETDGYGVAEHLQAFSEHTKMTVTHIIANSNIETLPAEWAQLAVQFRQPAGFTGSFITADVVDEKLRTRHDPAKLAKLVIDIARKARRD